MTVETQGALQSAFWAVDRMGAFTAWRPSTDAPQGQPRGKRRRKRGKGTWKRLGRWYQERRPHDRLLTNENDTRKVSL